jgi:ribosomal protein S18 acetylase RimI-like enzyme
VIEITTDLTSVDVERVFEWLSGSYWAQGRPREVVEKSIANSLCFGAFRGGEFVGFARVVTDRATFAWLCDVVVDPQARGRGVGKALIQAVVEHEDLKDIKRIILATRDAQGLYEPFGFETLPNPERWMTKLGQAHRAASGL